MASSNLANIQVFQETGKVVWYSYILKNFLHKGVSIVNEVEVHNLLEFSCFF